ncbi:hypothetical protein INT48_003520, partial [Thamnidium elegans]
PRRLNSIDIEMIDTMLSNLMAWEISDEAKIILLKGAGRAFCAGGNVKDLINKATDPNRHNELDRQVYTHYDLLHFMATIKTPYIAIMDGVTMGSGCGLSGFAHFKIATENTQYAMPENPIGLFCDAGASFFLSRLDGHLGAYLSATSRTIKGEDVFLEALEARLCKLRQPTHDIINREIQQFSVKPDHAAVTYTLHGKNREIIDACFKHERMEDVLKALKEDGTKFSQDTIESILQSSPTSVKITHELIRRGASLSFKDCLDLEYGLWETVPFAHDFSEGVSARVINKTLPKWNPNKFEDIDLDRDIRAGHFSIKKKLHFTNSQDFYEHPHKKYVLPTEKKILDMKSLHCLKGVQDTTAWFGSSKFGVKQKVRDVFERNKISYV